MLQISLYALVRRSIRDAAASNRARPVRERMLPEARGARMASSPGRTSRASGFAGLSVAAAH